MLEAQDQETILQEILEVSASTFGRGFFETFVRSLARASGARWVMYADHHTPGRAQTLALWDGDRIGEPIEYDLAGTPCEDVVRGGLCVHPRDVQRLFPRDRWLEMVGAVSYGGIPIRGPDGTSLGHFALVDTRPIEDEGWIRFLLRFFAARLATEHLRLRAEERFRATFEHTAVGISHVTIPEGRFLRVNDRYCQMMAYSRQELLGMTFRGVTAPEHLERGMDRLSEVLAGRLDSFTLEKLFQRKDGTRFWGHLTASFVRSQTGGDLYGIGVVQDISDRKELERNLKSAVVDLARSNADLRQFAHVVSHDLQEPLRLVTSYSELLRRRSAGVLDAEAEEFLDRVVGGAKRMQGMIHSLLEYSRVMARSRTLEAIEARVPLSLALANLRVAIDEAGGRVTCGDLPVVFGDAATLTILFQNLIANALKFSGTRPEVRIGAERDADSWVFMVEDAGPGIPQEEREEVFGLFRRRAIDKGTPGSGLGLAICRKIVEQHGGRIWIETSGSGGTSFRFTLRPAPAVKKNREASN